MPDPSHVVLICGGRWHDFDFARRELLGELSVPVKVFADYSGLDATDGAKALVSYTCDVRPSPAEQDALAGFVTRGGRWLALHGTNSAIDPPDVPGGLYRTPRALGKVAELLGGQFLAHPPIAPYTVHVTAPGHPLVSGIEPFEVRDELYICEPHPPLEVLLHARFTGECRGFARGRVNDDEPRPVLYLKRSGSGAVCYFTLGHCRGEDQGSWPVPEFRTVLRRCLAWAIDGVGHRLGPPPQRARHSRQVVT